MRSSIRAGDSRSKFVRGGPFRCPQQEHRIARTHEGHRVLARPGERPEGPSKIHLARILVLPPLRRGEGQDRRQDRLRLEQFRKDARRYREPRAPGHRAVPHRVPERDHHERIGLHREGEGRHRSPQLHQGEQVLHRDVFRRPGRRRPHVLCRLEQQGTPVVLQAVLHRLCREIRQRPAYRIRAGGFRALGRIPYLRHQAQFRSQLRHQGLPGRIPDAS